MKTLRAALLGSPVEHSLSPRLHAAAGRSVGIEVDYLLKDVQADGLAHALKWARSIGLRGLNITAPLKGAICPLLDELCPLAQHLNAVNTVVFDEAGRAIGTNTDVYGFVRSIHQVLDGPVLVLGAGGAARAVVQGCLDMGIKTLRILSRRPEQAEELADCYGDVVRAGRLSEFNSLLATQSVLINALPPSAWLSLEASLLGEMPSGSLVYDLNYGGRESILRDAAEGSGLIFQDGLGMLSWQGIRSFELWTGLQATFDSVRTELNSVHKCHHSN